MMGTAEKLIQQLREKLKKKSGVMPDRPSMAISPAETAEIFRKLKNSWADIEADKEILHRFIDEWVDSHL